MANYSYPNSGYTFLTRDGMAPDDNEKIIRGVQLDVEFVALVPAIASKMNHENPVWTGTMNAAASSGSDGIIYGGTY